MLSLPSLVMSFNDPARGTELASFRPAYATTGARLAATRAAAQIRVNADFVARKLPAVDALVKQEANRR